MAQKFGNARWVKNGFLDNRVPGRVVGRITFAAMGPVEFFLRGDFKGEIQGKLIIFSNPSFEDDDVAGHVLGEMENPQTGAVSLMSFQPRLPIAFWLTSLTLMPTTIESVRQLFTSGCLNSDLAA